jgi:hypothetical protein
MGRPAAAVGRGRVSARRARDVDSTISAHWLRLMSSVHIATDWPCMKQLIHCGILTLSVQAAADLEMSNGVWFGDENESITLWLLEILDKHSARKTASSNFHGSRDSRCSFLSIYNSIDTRNLLLFLSGKHKSPFAQRHSTSCTLYRRTFS